MKKSVFFLLFNCFVAGATAQDSLKNSSFFSITAGASIPTGDFASDNVQKINAGMAENGWNIEVKYAHQFDELFGFSSAFVYAQFPIKKVSNNENPTLSIKPCDYYELLIGPMITGLIAERVFVDLSILSGTAFINATKVNRNGETVPRKYPATAIPLKCALDFRYSFNDKCFFFAGTSYSYMRPTFNVTVQLQDLSFKQSMNAFGINGGIGFIF